MPGAGGIENFLRMKWIRSLLLLFAFDFQFLFAQEKIECDRPDQTETSSIVPAKHFQMESGFNYEYENSGEWRFVYPSALLKYGIEDIAEFRLEIENSSAVVHDESGRKIIHGISPVTFGMKLKICEEKKHVPKISVIMKTSIPILASGKLRENFATPEIRFTFQHTLSKKISLGYNFGGLWDGENSKSVVLYTLTSAYSITENIGCYLELYGFFSDRIRFIIPVILPGADVSQRNKFIHRGAGIIFSECPFNFFLHGGKISSRRMN